MKSLPETAYVARQPILDRHGNLIAYELLFRNSPTLPHAGSIADAVQATAQVLENVLNNMGIQKIVGEHKAFVNCSRELLLSGLLATLDPHRFVLEILETVQIDTAVASAVAQLNSAGFELALDDFVMSPEALRHTLPLLPYVKYVKIDLVGSTPRERGDAVRILQRKGIILLAEKVETEAEFQACLQEGYELFQGYFFARPELIASRRLDPRISGIMQLLQVLRKDPDMPELENAFKRQP